MTEPLRVAQVLGRMDYGGVEAVVLNYYRAMDHRQIQFDFFYEQTSLLPQREELAASGAGLYALPAYTHVAAYQSALCKLLMQNNYAVVHAHLNTMNVFPLYAAKRAGVPVRIGHNHSTAHAGEGKKTLLKYLLRPLAAQFATDYFACGLQAAQWMYGEKRVRDGQVTIMPNAIDTRRFAFDPAVRAEVRAELNLPPDALVVGHAGRFVYQKNHTFLLALFAALRAQCPHAKLLLIGEGPLEQEIRAQAQGLEPHILFLGARRDMPRLYHAMDAFCLPSFYEGLPVVGVEAQANGLPCLFSALVTPEILWPEQACSLPLSAGAEAWAQKLETLLRAGRTAPAQDKLQAFDIQVQAARMQRFYLQKAKREAASQSAEV